MLFPHNFLRNKLGYDLRKGDYMLNNFALSKIPLEQQDLTDDTFEKVLIHSDPSGSPLPGDQWRIRRRGSTQAEDISNR